MRQYLRLYILFSIISWSLFAQDFGSISNKIQWQSINTDSINVIFPAGLDSIAQRVASLALYQQEKFKTLGTKIKKFDIVLHHQTSESNAYVSLAPSRSYFFLTPPSSTTELGSMPWETMLTLHEYRHIQQYNNFNQGISALAQSTLGEQARALFSNMIIPNWFFEGDAVYNETILTLQGRGRIPRFFSHYKALLQSGERYNYMQLRNGSFKKFIPNHYALGYLLVSYGYEKYGDDIWKNITSNALQRAYIPYSFQASVRKYTGVSFPNFVQNSLEFFRQQWQKENNDSIEWFPLPSKKSIVRYTHIYPANDDGIIAQKNDFQQREHFIWKNKQKETKLLYKMPSIEKQFGYNKQQIVYTSPTPHIRWDYINYNDIIVADIQSKKQRKITYQQHYFSPDIAQNGQYITATELLPNQSSSIVLLDSSGRVLDKISAPNNHLFYNPKFIDTENIVYITRNELGHLRINKWHIPTHRQDTLTDFNNVNMHHLVVKNDTLFYTLTQGCYDEAWAFVLKEKKHYRLAQYSTGIYQSFIQQNKLLASVMTETGEKIGQFIPRWEESIPTPNYSLPYLQHYSRADIHTAHQFPLRSFSSQPYRPAKHLFNFHSRQPIIDAPLLGFVLLSSNTFNSLLSSIGYAHNINDKSHHIFAQMNYGGWFVQPYFKTEIALNRSALTNHLLNTYQHWNEYNIQIGVQLPLNLSGGMYFRNLFVSSSIAYRYFTQQQALTTNFTLNYSQQTGKAYQQILPEWSQAFHLYFSQELLPKTTWQITSVAKLSFPGLSNTHSSSLQSAYQYKSLPTTPTINHIFPIARGYSNYAFTQAYTVNANYHFPLCYPDAGVGNLLYLKRIRNNFFYDNTFAQIAHQYHTLSSIGTEIYFDCQLWNVFPFSFGLRGYLQLHQKKEKGIELIIPIPF